MDILKWPPNGPLPTQNPDTLLATHENRAKMLRAGLYARVERPTDAGNAEEAWKRGWSRAEKKVVMGDGAEWIWNLAKLHFPGAVQIVDLYHARQYLWELARKLYPNDEVSQKARIKVHEKRLLDKGKVEKLVVAIRSIHSTNPEVTDKIRTEADSFETNAERMRYPQLRRQHLFVGSGVIEAGCKTVIGSRLTQSGMFWTVAVPTPYWRYAAATSTAVPKTTGRHDVRPNLNFYVAHPK
jgi:hypothetical protein